MPAAYVVFLYRRDAEISWRESTIVLVLFALGVATKENAVALAGVLVLTDWRSGSLQKNWRLYAADGVRGRSLPPPYSACSLTPGQPDSASPPTGYEYAFTQARAIWVYLRMALLPFGQSLDHDFTASRTIRQNGAIFGLAAILALIAIAVLWRRRYPLASLGILMFLVWLAPTSIVIPIDDALIERRMYFPLLGLVIADCEVARRWRPAWAGAVLVLMLASRLWGRTLACLGQPSADWKNWNKPPECTRARRWISRLVW